MTTLVTSRAPVQSAVTSPLWQSRWLWCCLAVALVLLRAWSSGDLAAALRGYGDTDDATRLVQVRTFMAGAGWYDLLLERFGGPTPLVSHWSRLIDLPLALLLGGLSTIMAPETAELAVRFAWPSLLLLLLFRVLANAADHEAGPVAAGAAIALAATMLTGLFRFTPGRIDHHNVMVLATVAGLLLLLRALQRPQLGYAAGTLFGLAVVVGYEPVALIIPLLALLVAGTAFDTRLLRPARNTVLAFAMALAAGLAVTYPPSLWLLPVCDAISLNVVAAALVGAVGLWHLDRHGHTRTILFRLGLLTMVGIVAVAVFATLSPGCLAGPFAGMSAAAKRLWLDQVVEGYTIVQAWTIVPDSVILLVATIAASLTTAIIRFKRLPTMGRAALICILVVSAIGAMLTYKLFPYFSFIAAYAIALWIADLADRPAMPARSQRLAALLALNQSTAAIVLVPVVLGASTWLMPKNLQPLAQSYQKAALSNAACFEMTTMRSLATLPKGLIVARPDLGPFIVASSQHDALAAPYHRIDRAIVLSHDILSASPELAAVQLRRIRADYVAICGVDKTATGTATSTSLDQRLQRDERVDFLEAIPLAPASPLRIWRVLH